MIYLSVMRPLAMILISVTLLVYMIPHFWWPFHLMISCTLPVVVNLFMMAILVSVGMMHAWKNISITDVCPKDATNKPNKYGV